MYHQEPPISITKAANGWIVQLPMIYSPVMAGPDYTSPEDIKRMARIMKQEMNRDPLLEDLGAYDQEEKTTISVAIPQQPENNIFIFATWDLASAFIKQRYDN